MGREPRQPELLRLRRLRRHGVRGRLPGHDQVGQDVPGAEPREVLGTRGGELGKGDGALISQSQTRFNGLWLVLLVSRVDTTRRCRCEELLYNRAR